MNFNIVYFLNVRKFQKQNVHKKSHMFSYKTIHAEVSLFSNFPKNKKITAMLQYQYLGNLIEITNKLLFLLSSKVKCIYVVPVSNPVDRKRFHISLLFSYCETFSDDWF